MNPIQQALNNKIAPKKPLVPLAQTAQNLRKSQGDNLFPVFADKMMESMKKKRAMAQSEKAAGY